MTHRPELRMFNAPDSSNVKSVTYAEDFKTLLVVFTGSVRNAYMYNDVPVEVYEQLRDADSVGKAFNSIVKNKFESTKG